MVHFSTKLDSIVKRLRRIVVHSSNRFGVSSSPLKHQLLPLPLSLLTHHGDDSSVVGMHLLPTTSASTNQHSLIAVDIDNNGSSISHRSFDAAIDRLRNTQLRIRIYRLSHRLSHSRRTAAWLLSRAARNHLSTKKTLTISLPNAFLEIFAYLPDDLTEHVFRFLPSIDIPRISRVCHRWQHLVCERRSYLPKVIYSRMELELTGGLNEGIVRFSDYDQSGNVTIISPSIHIDRMLFASKHIRIIDGIEIYFSVLTAECVEYLQLNKLHFDHITQITLLMEPDSLNVEDLFAMLVAVLTNRHMHDTTLNICFRHDGYRPKIAALRRQLVDSHARSLRKICRIRKIQEIRHKHYCNWNLTMTSFA